MRLSNYLIFLFLVISLSISVTALGLRPPDTYVDYEPGKTVEVSYTIDGTPNEIDVEYYGTFEDHATISEVIRDANDNYAFTLTIEFPDSWDIPGPQKLNVKALEKLNETRGAVGARVGIIGWILISVPYPGTYADMVFDAPDGNINDTILFHVNLINRGTNDIGEAVVKVEILSGEEVVAVLDSESISLETRKSHSFYLPFNTTGHPAGTYVARATANYDELSITSEKGFRIGELSINLVNYTREVMQNKIEKVDFIIQSGWNDALPNTYVQTHIIDLETDREVAQIRTPSFTLKPWEQLVTSAYWDTTALRPGPYKANIFLHFDKRVKEMSGTLTVIAPEIIEEAKPFPTVTVALISLIVLLILFNLLLFFFKRRREEDEDEDEE